MTNSTLSDKELYQYKGLWHGIELPHFIKYLRQGYMEARTVHRNWKDGRSFQEKDSEYENSFWMKGWCFTREREFALQWRDIAIVLDNDLIKRDFKVKPISWTARRNHHNNHKLEMEEFVVSDFINKTTDEIKDEYLKLLNSFSIGEELNQFRKEFPDEIEYGAAAGSKTINIEKYVKGFFISDDLIGLYDEEITELTAHHLFKGFYNLDKILNRKHLRPSHDFLK